MNFQPVDALTPVKCKSIYDSAEFLWSSIFSFRENGIAGIVLLYFRGNHNFFYFQHLSASKGRVGWETVKLHKLAKASFTSRCYLQRELLTSKACRTYPVRTKFCSKHDFQSLP